MHIDTEATRHLQGAAQAARAASRQLARSSAEQRDAGLKEMARALRAGAADILAANAADIAGSAGSAGTAAFRDRLALNSARLEAMAGDSNRLLRCPIRSAARWRNGRGRTDCSSGGSPHRSA